MEKQKNGIGRRKAAVTRVFLSKGRRKDHHQRKRLQNLFSVGLFTEPGRTPDENC
jgi:ribosomal protein S9